MRESSGKRYSTFLSYHKEINQMSRKKSRYFSSSLFLSNKTKVNKNQIKTKYISKKNILYLFLLIILIKIKLNFYLMIQIIYILRNIIQKFCR